MQFRMPSSYRHWEMRTQFLEENEYFPQDVPPRTLSWERPSDQNKVQQISKDMKRDLCTSSKSTQVEPSNSQKGSMTLLADHCAVQTRGNPAPMFEVGTFGRLF